jgi:hypothetical protein
MNESSGSMHVDVCQFHRPQPFAKNDELYLYRIGSMASSSNKIMQLSSSIVRVIDIEYI